MANGFLGKVMSVAGSYVKAYTVPANANVSNVTIVMCNTGTTDAKAKVAYGLNDTPSLVDHVEYGAVIPANGGVYRVTCDLLSANEKVLVNIDSAAVTIRVQGLEQL